MRLLVTIFLVFVSVSFSINLKIGIYDNYPLCYMEGGQARGFYIDILNYIAKKENWHIDYVFGNWTDLVEKLKKGKINALVAIAYTPERARIFVYNEEAFITNWGVVVSKKKVEKIFDLESMRVALIRDDVYARGFMNLVKSFKLKLGEIYETHTYKEALQALSKGEVDAAVVSRISALIYKGTYKYRISPIVFTPVELRIAFSRSTPFLENVIMKIDEDLKKMKSDKNSVYWKATQKYLLETGEFPTQQFLAILLASLATFSVVLTYLFMALKKRAKKLRVTTENLRAANEQIKSMDIQIRDLYNELQRTFEKFQEGMEIIARISTFDIEEEEFLERILRLALDLIPKAKYGSVSLLNGDEWRFAVAVGHDIEALRKLKLKREYTFLDLKKPVIIEKIFEKDKDIIPEPEYSMMRKASKPAKSSLIAPIRMNDEPIGFFSLDIPLDSDESFTEIDVDTIDKFARIISLFYSLRKFREVEKNFQRDIVLTLVKALEFYDIYTRGHSERVANLSKRLAENLGLPKDQVRKVYWAALVHDIGKIYVSQSILNKPTKLTDEEYEQIKEHPVKGYEMLKESPSLSDLAVIVLHHHERCDGSGYPDGLKCDEIPIESRIIAVVDAFDAMTSSRSYREPMSVDQAIVELLKNAGTQFDPKVVEAFVEMIEEMRIGRSTQDASG